MKKKILLPLFLILALFNASAALAITPDISIVNTVTKALTATSVASILPMALTWLGAFFTVQFVITNLALIKSGADIEAVFGKLIGSMVWIGFCLILINKGPDFIDSVGTGILTKFAPNIPGPGSIILSTLGLCGSVLMAISFVGTSIAGVGNSSLGTVLVVILILIFAVGMYMAIKIFMLQLELGLIVMLAPLSFSFLGLDALKDQGIAPFKSLISLVYRIILMGIICSAFGMVIDNAGADLAKFGKTDFYNPLKWVDIFNTFLSAICAFPILAFLVYKSDSIAASLASGTTSMGPSDIGSAVAAGVAGGMAMAAAGAAATAAVGQIPSAAGSMSNAGGAGSGNPQSIPDPSALSSLIQPSGGSLDSQMQAVAASEKAMATGNAGGTAGSTSVDGVTPGGSDTGGGKSAPFSKADGAKAAATVPVTAGQNSKNAAAVGAAMRASGAHENMAALAESMAEQGNGVSEISNACCNSPIQSAAVENAMAGAADPGWLDSGSAVSPGGSGAGAGIGNGGADTKAPTFGDHLKNLGESLDKTSRHFQSPSPTHVSVSAHHSE